MENPELANTSTKIDKKKKSKLYANKHGGGQEVFLHSETDVKPRKSFWKNLFRKQSKKSEVPEMVDQKTALLSSRLNAIFEEPKTPEDKENVVEEIEEIKKTLKKIGPSQPPSVLLSGIVASGTDAPDKVTLLPSDEPLLDFLSDVSSTSGESLEPRVATTTTNKSARDSLDDLVTKLSSGDPKQRENSIGGEGYSFEYSETSEQPSCEDVATVKFDERVKQKDADSNIVESDLNPGEEQQELTPLLPLPTPEETADIPEDDPEMVTGSCVSSSLPLISKIPIAVPLSSQVAGQQNKPPQIKRFPDILAATGASGGPSAVLNNFITTKQETPSVESLEETEMWNERLNKHPAASTVMPTPVQLNSLDENEAGCREYRLDNFFKMTFRPTDNQVLNYSVAYDPIFKNLNVHCFQHPNLGETEIPKGDEKQKVVRKRKEMSLLHDKNKMAEYLREIEQQQTQKKTFHNFSCQTDNSCDKLNLLSVPQNSPSDKTSSNRNLSIADENENVLVLLESTKQKLQKYLEKNSDFDPKVLSLYPDNYLEIFNLISKPAATKSESLNDLNPKNIKNSNFSNSSHSDISPHSVDSFKSASDIIKNSQIDLAGLPTFENKFKQFENVQNEIENIFQELLVNILELQELCVLNGITKDENEDKEPLITMEPLEQNYVVTSLLDDILEKVFEISEKKESFSFGPIYDEPGQVNIKSAQHNFINPSTTLQNELQRSEGFLTALKDEICEYNIVSYLAIPNLGEDEYIDRFDNQQVVQIASKENLEDDPLKNEPSDPKIELNEAQSDPVRQTAEKLVNNIEESLNTTKEIEKSQKFGLFYNRKPGESLEMAEKNKLLQKKKQNKKTRTTEPPEVTASLQHIFFGENSGQIIQSEFNLVDENAPTAGPSKHLKQTENSLNTSLPHLPTPPNTDLFQPSAGSLKFHTKNTFESQNYLQTLLESRLSGITGSSVQEEIPPDLVTFGQGSCSSTYQHKENLQLERKAPETNLNIFGADKNLDKDEFEKSVADNLKKFEEKLSKINETNQKTAKMLSSSTYLTPEDSLSILSTITENLLESTTSRTSRTVDDRYPQFIPSSTTSIIANPKYNPNKKPDQ